MSTYWRHNTGNTRDVRTAVKEASHISVTVAILEQNKRMYASDPEIAPRKYMQCHWGGSRKKIHLPYLCEDKCAAAQCDAYV